MSAFFNAAARDLAKERQLMIHRNRLQVSFVVLSVLAPLLPVIFICS